MDTLFLIAIGSLFAVWACICVIYYQILVIFDNTKKMIDLHNDYLEQLFKMLKGEE